MTDVGSSPIQVGIVGTGRMAGILLRASARYAPSCILRLAGRNPASCETLRRQVPSCAIVSAEDLARLSDIVILAVPPEACRPVLASLTDRLAPAAIVVCMANGVPLSSLADVCANPIVKVIPTVAHEVGRGVALVVAGPGAGAAEIARTTSVFGAFSRPVVVDDSDNRIASNVAGSFVALAAAMTEMFVAANAARATTLDEAELRGMAAETLGAISALVRDGHGFSDIVHATATPGGTTEAALQVLSAEFPPIATAMVDATFRRQAAMQAGATRAREP